MIKFIGSEIIGKSLEILLEMIKDKKEINIMDLRNKVNYGIMTIRQFLIEQGFEKKNTKNPYIYQRKVEVK
jgi:hypothetical protein